MGNNANIDIQIYLQSLKDFFKKNPNDLYQLIPKGTESKFYELIQKLLVDKLSRGEDVILSEEQLITISIITTQEYLGPFVQTQYGLICYN